MKSGKQIKLIAGVIGLMIFLCSALFWLAVIFTKDERPPLPALICCGFFTILSPIMILVGLSSIEKPWKALTGGLKSARRRIGSSTKTVKILNYLVALILAFGGVVFIFSIIPTLFSGRDLTQSQIIATVIVVSILLIGFLLAGFTVWISGKDNQD